MTDSPSIAFVKRRNAECAQLVALLRELAKARPVPLDALASTLGWSETRVATQLEQQACCGVR